MQPLTLTIESMHCDKCVQRVRDALTALPGVTVKNVAVGSADLEYDPAKVSSERIVTDLSRAGYRAHEAGTGADASW